jgi:hypothetical protein
MVVVVVLGASLPRCSFFIRCTHRHRPKWTNRAIEFHYLFTVLIVFKTLWRDSARPSAAGRNSPTRGPNFFSCWLFIQHHLSGGLTQKEKKSNQNFSLAFHFSVCVCVCVCGCSFKRIVIIQLFVTKFVIVGGPVHKKVGVTTFSTKKKRKRNNY